MSQRSFQSFKVVDAEWLHTFFAINPSAGPRWMFYATMELPQELLNNYNIVVFDLEADEKTIHEYAFKENNSEATVVKNHVLEPLTNAFRKAHLIVGHNIKRWDIIKLNENESGLTISQDKVWDTLEVEEILARHLDHKHFKLNTVHKAKEDVEKTFRLFCSQIRDLLSLSEEEIKECTTFFSDQVKGLIDNAIRLNIVIEDSDETFYYAPLRYPCLPNLSGETTGRKLIIAPRLLWPTIYEAFESDENYSRDIVFLSQNLEQDLEQDKDYKCFNLNGFAPEENHGIALKRWYDEGKKRPIDLPVDLISYIDKNLSLFLCPIKQYSNVCICLDDYDGHEEELRDFADKIIFVMNDLFMSNIDRNCLLKYIRFIDKPACRVLFLYPQFPFIETQHPKVLLFDNGVQKVEHPWERRIGLVESVREIESAREMNKGSVVIVGNDDYHSFSSFSNSIIKWENRQIKGGKIGLDRQIELAARDGKTIVINKTEFLSLPRKLKGMFNIFFDAFPDYETTSNEHNEARCKYPQIKESQEEAIELVNGVRYYSSMLFETATVFFLNPGNDFTFTHTTTTVSWPRSIRQTDIRKAIRSFSKEIQFPDIEDIEAWICEKWSFRKLRDFQKKALQTIIQAQTQPESKILVLAPTSAGKSLVFQSLALYRKMRFNTIGHLTIVVSPLLALMRDQVTKLHKRFPAIADTVAAIIQGDNSINSYRETNKILDNLVKGKICLLYISPERFRSRRFNDAMTKFFKKGYQLDRVVFDEAHCISLWGTDFRPDYIYAARKCREWQENHSLQILLFSATVSEAIKQDIQKEISKDNKGISVICSDELKDFPVNNNILFGFLLRNNPGDIDEIIDILQNEVFVGRERIDKILVFCRKRDETENYKDSYIEHSHNLSDKVDYYHAGLSNKRESIEESFKKNSPDGDRVDVLFATKAFGMGMDVPNIHHLLHDSPPDCIDDYLQEIGRAGRDGKESHTICYYSSSQATEDNVTKEFKWEDVKNYFSRIKDFFSAFYSSGNITGKRLIIPYNLLSDNRTDESDKRFIQALNWLSDQKGLKRLENMCSHSTIIYIKPKENLLKGDFSDLEYREVLLLLQAEAKKSSAAAYVSVPVNKILAECNISSVDQLWRILRRANYYFEIPKQNVCLKIASDGWRGKELNDYNNGNRNPEKLTVLNNAIQYCFSARENGIVELDTIVNKIREDHQFDGTRQFYEIALTNQSIKNNTWGVTSSILQSYRDGGILLKDCMTIIDIALNSSVVLLEDFPADVQSPFLCIAFLKNLQYLTSTSGLGYDGIEIELLSIDEIDVDNIESDRKAYEQFQDQVKMAELRKKCMSNMVEKFGQKSVEKAWEKKSEITEYINDYFMKSTVAELEDFLYRDESGTATTR